MLFNFRLHDLVDVAPFGREGEPVLHWFGLTDGCYWLQFGDTELFRYSQAFLDLAASPSPCDPYVDYYVVRLWEDMLDILPDVLTPVPEALNHLLSPDNWFAWKERAVKWARGWNDDQSEYLLALATEWWIERHLDSGHLRHGPRLWLWNDGIDIHTAWDNRGLEEGGTIVWAADIGEATIRVEVFLEELALFDWRLMKVMRQRVNEVLNDWPRPEIGIDKDQLVREHEDRSKWLERTVHKSIRKKPPDWDAVIKAVETINAARS